MKKQYLYDMFFADAEISHIIKSIPHDKINNQLRRLIYSRMILICEDLTNNKIKLDKVLKPSFFKNCNLWLTGQWINHFSKGVKQDFVFKRSYLQTKHCKSWESEIEGFIVILTKAGYFSYFNALKSAKTLFKRDGGFYYGRDGERVACFSHTSTERLIINNMRVLLNYGAILGGKSRNFVKSQFSPYSGQRFKDSTGLSFIVTSQKLTRLENSERISITFHHQDYKGNSNVGVLKNIKECLINVLTKMPHVSNITATSYDKDINVEFSINTYIETPVTTSPAELVEPAPVEVPKPVEPIKAPITDDDIRAHLQNKIVVLSDEIGVLIQERDNISEQINDRTEKLDKIRKLIEVL